MARVSTTRDSRTVRGPPTIYRQAFRATLAPAGKLTVGPIDSTPQVVTLTRQFVRQFNLAGLWRIVVSRPASGQGSIAAEFECARGTSA